VGGIEKKEKNLPGRKPKRMISSFASGLGERKNSVRGWPLWIAKKNKKKKKNTQKKKKQGAEVPAFTHKGQRASPLTGEDTDVLVEREKGFFTTPSSRRRDQLT